MIMKLFELWNLSTTEQLDILGLDKNDSSNLIRYYHEIVIGRNPDLHERIVHLLSIHKSLRIIFPHNTELCYIWPTTKNKIFNNKTPVEVMQEYGYSGILMIRHYLDRERSI